MPKLFQVGAMCCKCCKCCLQNIPCSFGTYQDELGTIPTDTSDSSEHILSFMCECRSSKNSSPKRGNLSPPRGDVSPKRDVSPKPSRAGTIRGPFVLSANPSAFSLSTLPSTMQAGVAPLPGVEAFPELAAMEADFQKSLARGTLCLVPSPSQVSHHMPVIEHRPCCTLRSAGAANSCSECMELLCGLFAACMGCGRGVHD